MKSKVKLYKGQKIFYYIASVITSKTFEFDNSHRHNTLTDFSNRVAIDIADRHHKV